MSNVNILSNISAFNAINNLIEEYCNDKANLNPNKLIMQYYHRMFTLLVASTFESSVKDSIDVFINNSLNKYPSIQIHSSDKLYKKFYTDPNLDANPFYDMFCGIDFKNQLTTTFNSNLASHKEVIKLRIQGFSNINVPCEELETVNLILDEINFDEAETAFLKLKYNRNKVAHNFLTNSFSNTTFNDIKEYYYKSMYYVESLVNLMKFL